MAAALLLAGALLASVPVHGYELGMGYPLPWGSVVAGGYATVRAGHLDGVPEKAAVEDLSLFLSGGIVPRWRFFTELELGNPVVWRNGGPTIADAEFHVERLYLDHSLTPRASLRLGKFLTPIGRWNLIHAEPLVWSIFRPLTTASAFARNASGAELIGTRSLTASELEYRLWADDSQALDRAPGGDETYLDAPVEPNPPNLFNQAGGLRLCWRALDDDLQIGLSSALFNLRQRDGNRVLVGTDLFYRHAAWELTGEAVYRWGTNGAGDEWGGFAQVAAPLGGGLYAVLSGERFKAEGYDRATDSARVGLAWRPKPALTVKIEYQESGGEEELAPDGWLFSISALF
ncbi:MAG: hypothetical protein LJE69_18080 [Thiohalocapsa sp.]|uniref:hypothetical protein n=1 Tax=Thiohalocapsa sp. TaxID=2497641 RepID=UPI0025F59C38|nr:hypothetical protein [Thiohalocapsa sp.]MCG6943144.1 hypothetical protein [Thiohalocapsa sp.]